MVCHILNGDALKDQLNGKLGEDVIICREVMMDGLCTGASLSEVFDQRLKYFQEELKISSREYSHKVIKELEQIHAIPHGSDIYLWFEDDLFCQANFWFCVFILSTQNKKYKLHYVRPTGSLRYGFGGMTLAALLKAKESYTVLSNQEIDIILKIWRAFQQNDKDRLIVLSNEINSSLPWVTNAINAHIARFAPAPALGAHEEIMLNCILSLEDKSFSKVFSKFSEEAAIYGYGDRQARKIYDKMIKLA